MATGFFTFSRKMVARWSVLLTLAAGVSCASSKQTEVLPAKPLLFEWNGDSLPGPTTVHIALNEQKAYFFRGGQPAGWTFLASGKAGHPTPQGRFYVSEKVVDKISSNYGMIVNSSGTVIDYDARIGREYVPPGCRFVGAPMPHWMRLTGYGIGMHAGYIPDPGYPASHGCIRLPHEMAAKLFDYVDLGTLVTITGRAPQT